MAKARPAWAEDPQNYLNKRGREISRKANSLEVRDEQELREREEAAQAYAGENEQHFVDYCMDCVDTSVHANRSIRQVQEECWAAYNEHEPLSYADKEDWQSRIVVPRPFQTVQYGASAVRKAFSPDFLSVKNYKDEDKARFWEKVMEFYLRKEQANFPLKFTDANIMALAIGISLEMIPRWIPGKGLEFSLVEPWKIHRDPDALARDAQSGMYWIHQEWLDYFVLKRGEESGRYFDVARVTDFNSTAAEPDDPFMTEEAIKRRKQQIWDDRSKFRKMILTSEFWGMVLDPRGELLLPSATFTIAGGRVIQRPKTELPFTRMRWPGVSFSPLPDILRHGGRGLLKGVLTIWKAMCDIMCLHQDNLIWVVNPMREINTDALVDPADVNTYPGKEFLTKDTVSGSQAVRSVDQASRTNEVLANAQFYDQYFQRGSMVPDNIQGLPGWRQEITYREAAMNLDQALGVYSLMGENIEDGAISAIEAAFEMMSTYATISDYQRAFTDEEWAEFAELFEVMEDPEAPNGIANLPDFDGAFHVSGMTALMQEQETLMNLKQVVMPLANDPRFGPYIKPYEVVRAFEKRTNLEDEKVFVTQEEAQLMEKMQELKSGEEEDAMKKLQHLQELMGVTELMAKLQEIQKGDLEMLVKRIDQIEQLVEPQEQEPKRVGPPSGNGGGESGNGR